MVAHRTQGDIGRRMARRFELGHSSYAINAMRLYCSQSSRSMRDSVKCRFARTSATGCGC